LNHIDNFPASTASTEEILKGLSKKLSAEDYARYRHSILVVAYAITLLSDSKPGLMKHQSTSKERMAANDFFILPDPYI